jgi:hypothetical protein
MIVSSDLPVGYTGTIAADQLNRLRDDLLKNHTHASGEGGTVSHGNLTDEEIDDTYLTHARINQHIQSTGTSSDPDPTGGISGVHGLASGQYVVGHTRRQLVIQIGSGTTDRGGEEGDNYEQRGRGTFSIPFAEIPEIIWCINTSGESAIATVYQRLTTSVAVKFRFMTDSQYMDGNQHNIPFIFAAMGVIEA